MFGKLVIVLVLAALAVGLAARSSHGAGPERTYAGDVREGVWKLEQRNHLRSATLTPGQVLVVSTG